MRVVNAAERARQHRRVAERAYGKGWRPDDLPACAEAPAGEAAGAWSLPHCERKGRLVDAGSECGPDCPTTRPTRQRST